jgi:hypothetical protein
VGLRLSDDVRVPSLLLRVRHAEEAAKQARLMARLALEVSPDVPIRRPGAALPGDRDAMRGVPLLVKGGRGGAIRGSVPGSNLR